MVRYKRVYYRKKDMGETTLRRKILARTECLAASATRIKPIMDNSTQRTLITSAVVPKNELIRSIRAIT